ncbi:MAG: response regulator [Anaerolineae bacterium]|nr:response regulator [Anaerolineae bacterium]
MFAQTDFLEQIRDALNHLHDYPHLETHPFALRCWPENPPEGPNRAQRLYRLLLESIESLNPPAGSARSSSQTEHYLLLVYRYVEGQEVAEVMRALGYSRRQFFREQRKALLRLAALLWQKIPQSTPTPVQTDDLLSSEAERVLAQRETVHLKDVVQGVLASVSALAEQHHVTLQAPLADRLPPVYGNRTLLRQVLLKILSELITRPDTRRVYVQAQRSGRGVTVAVSGRPQPGVPAEARTNREEEQALNTARRLVEMMGGQWQGYESDARGSICRFSLPPDTQRILLAVEDNEAVVRAFRRYLIGYGYQVVGTSGPEALRLARELRPAAIALDVMMPLQDGWEVLQGLKNDQATRDIPVIVCSVLDDPELAYSLGAAAYLHKPVTQADLLTALAALSGAG